MSESKTIETPNLTEQERIEIKCQELGETCEGLLGDYGTIQTLSPQTSFPRSFFHSMFNTFSTDITKVPTGEFRSIEKDVLIDGKRSNVHIWNVEGQIQIFEGNSNGEVLVIDRKNKSISWIKREKQPFRDINDSDTKYVPPTRRVTQADVTKYEKIIDLTRNDFVRNIR